MFSEYELERKDMIWSDLDAYDVIFRIWFDVRNITEG